ncbi:MAG: 3-keto-5-aminohexanoate cleavage protein [Syntrophobacterales bacterium]|nr:3-keto-5-aminohexanoate cleavage protein [Syntrophobacterales bacterium]
MEGKVIITAAITGGVHTPGMSPHLPITPQQIVEESVRAWEAGAAICHIHVRNPETGRPSPDINLIREVMAKIKSRCPIIVCISTGGGIGMTVEQRVKPVRLFRPELATLNAGSINFAMFHKIEKYGNFKYDWEKAYLEMTEDFIFPNTFKSIRQFLEIFDEQGTKPELEAYDAGMINNIAFLLSRGHIRKPVFLQFVLGILGGISSSPENLLFLIDYARRLIGDFEFSVCAAGRWQFPMATQSLLMGGNVRVGLEDNLYIARGKLATSNAEQVAKMVRIARELGIEPASPDEARQILSLKGGENVNF